MFVYIIIKKTVKPSIPSAHHKFFALADEHLPFFIKKPHPLCYMRLVFYGNLFMFR